MIDLIKVCSEMTKEEFLKEAGKVRMGNINTPEDCPKSYGMGPKDKCNYFDSACKECWDKAVTKAEIKFKEECVNE